jgi:hypothetical protein
MARAKDEKLLSADMDSEIVEKFLRQSSERGFTKKRALAAAVEHWTELSLEAQARLISKLSLNEAIRRVAAAKRSRGIES